jgi:hypothetical protein
VLKGGLKKMKKLFRKAVTVLGSTALIGATVAMAAAASYPMPFTSNTAIVVGANAAPSDNIAAASIASNLDANAATTGTTTITTDGDSYKFEKTSTKFHLGDSITDMKTDLDEDEMPVLLNDGTYTDEDNDDFDYTQKITMASGLTLGMFDDNDYKTDSPTVGIKLSSGANVLTYTLEFSEQPTFAKLDGTDLTMMGRDYYVLDDATADQITLLDSASDALISEGETVSVSAGGKTYSVGTEFVGELTVKLNVNGEITKALAAGDTYKLKDGSYLGLKEILYSAKDTGISKVEFSIGNGKLVIKNGAEVEMNEDSIDGLTAVITNDTTELVSIALTWATDDEVFITDDSVVTMPGFGAVALSFTGLEYPEEETIEVSYDGEDSLMLANFPLKDSTEDINLLYSNSTIPSAFMGLGKDSDEQLVTGATSLVFDGDTDAYFVASWTDGRDAESYLMRANNFKTDNSVDKVTFQYKKDGSWTDAKTDRKETDTVSLGNVEFTVGAVDRINKNVSITKVGDTSFDVVYSAEGMKVLLPIDSVTDGGANINISSGAETSYKIQMFEEDKDGDIAEGNIINVTGTIASEKVTVSTVAGMGGSDSEIGESDIFRNFVYSALATEMLWDKSGSDQNSVKLIYHGEEVPAGVYITSADAISSGGDAGVMTVKDVEVSTVAGKNLVVVGGSAINSVAAELLGGAYSEAMFTSATGVGAGEFLIQSFDRSGKTALLVAGYNAADTEKAVTYLLNNDVDTTVGTKMKGTSATEATVVTA